MKIFATYEQRVSKLREAAVPAMVNTSLEQSEFLKLVDKGVCAKMKAKYDPLKSALADFDKCSEFVQVFDPSVPLGVGKDAAEVKTRLRAGVALWGLYTLIRRPGWDDPSNAVNESIRSLYSNHFQDNELKEVVPEEALAILNEVVATASGVKRKSRASAPAVVPPGPEVEVDGGVGDKAEPPAAKIHKGRGRGFRGSGGRKRGRGAS